MAGREVFDALAEVARREGVEDCFALLGDANMAWATRLMQMGARLITVRHEHCAVAAATAYARAKGEVGVATVTCGPGLTQILTALPAAVRVRTPLVVFAGEAPVSAGWYIQDIDQAPFVTAAGARYVRLHHVPHMAEGLRDAFLSARTERVPVVVGVPSTCRRSLGAAATCRSRRRRSSRQRIRSCPIRTRWRGLPRSCSGRSGWSSWLAGARSPRGPAPPAARWPSAWEDCWRRRCRRGGSFTMIRSRWGSPGDSPLPPRAPPSPRRTWLSRSAVGSRSTTPTRGSSGPRQRFCTSTSSR